MTSYAIFDLDNCLSDDRARIQHIDWDAPNPTLKYQAYHALCANDPVGNLGTYRQVTAVATPIFLTARPETVRLQTRAWISRWLGISDPMLMMRQNTDHRPSVELKCDQLRAIPSVFGVPHYAIGAAYDDRAEIVDMYRAHGLVADVLCIHDVCAYTRPSSIVKIQATDADIDALAALSASRCDAPRVTAADVLVQMADTYRSRNAVYGDNFKMVAKLMAVLFPNGVPPELVVKDQFHLFELVLVKLSRYAISNLTHIDSAHDAAVYFAMCESINRNSTKEEK